MTPGCLTGFNPIAPLRRSDAATSIIFLTSEIHYCDAVIDPWFNAQTCDPKWPGLGWTTCHPAYPTAALACVEEQQICVGESPDSGRCVNTRANGYPYAHTDTGGLPNITQVLNLNPRQAAIATRMQDASLQSAFAEIIYDMGGTNLLAYGIRDGPSCAETLPSKRTRHASLTGLWDLH